MNYTKNSKSNKVKLTKAQYTKIAKKIKQCLIEYDLTQKDFSEIIMCAGETANMKINGKYDFSIPEAIMMSKKFKISLDELFNV